MTTATHETLGKERTVLCVSGMIFGVIGLLLSLYATFHQLEVQSSTGVTDAFCNINATFNCDDIARSPYSSWFGIPLGVLGIGYFLGTLTLLATAFIRSESARETLQAYAVLTGIGVLISLGLAGISFFALGKGCVVCIGVYVVILLQALFAYLNRNGIPKGWKTSHIWNGSTYVLLALLVSIGVFKLLKPAQNPPKLDLPQSAQQNAEAPSMTNPAAVDIPLNKTDYSGYGQDYRKGSDDAKVIVTEFADFQCPACSEMAKVLRGIHQEFGDKVLFVFRNYPLDQSCNSSIQQKFHEYACDAAKLVRCAGARGEFWKAHDYVYDNQKLLNSSTLRQWAKGWGLSDADIDQCLANKDVLAKIQDDVAVGNRLGIDGTPSVYINGHKFLGGINADALRREIQRRL